MAVNHPPDVLYWLWLQRCVGAASPLVQTVIEGTFSIKELYGATPEQLWQSGRFSLKTIGLLSNCDLSREERILRRCEELDISVTYPGDKAYPELLLNICNPPAVLFYQGDLRAMCRRPCIALVGTRSATEYGMEATTELARRLTEAGMTIVSGCARGIDTAAHTGALEAENGATIGVLGCGIDCRYNVANEQLRRRIAARGALVSEYPPGTDASPHHFPTRNRIISGLSLGTVVMEADSRSGSLITADLANEQGREVFVLPAGLGAPNSSGVNTLHDRGAYAVRCPLDVLGRYWPMYPSRLSLAGAERELMFGREPQKLPERKKKAGAAKGEPKVSPEAPPSIEPPAGVSDGAKKIFEYLRPTPLLLDDLAAQAGMSPPEALNLLTELELFGCVKAHPGSRYALVTE